MPLLDGNCLTTQDILHKMILSVLPFSRRFRLPRCPSGRSRYLVDGLGQLTINLIISILAIIVMIADQIGTPRCRSSWLFITITTVGCIGCPARYLLCASQVTVRGRWGPCIDALLGRFICVDAFLTFPHGPVNFRWGIADAVEVEQALKALLKKISVYYARESRLS